MHTKNFLADPRVSLLVSRDGPDQSATSAERLTLLGEIAVANGDAVRDIYLARHPESIEYIGFGDFAIYRLAVRDAYFVGGFGEMGWIGKLT